MGLEDDSLYGAVRVSFNREHTEEDVTMAIESIIGTVQRLQDLAAQ